MAKKSVSPIMTWAFWSISVLGVFLTVTWDYFVAGFSADSSYITWIIVLFFILGLGFSLRAALYLEKEFKSLNAMDANQRIGDANSSDAAALFDAALERIRRGDRVEMRNLISAYAARTKARTDNISVIANMLVTIGLLGTVLGLIMTVTGLDLVLQSSSADFASMKAGMNATVSGMGTAFYTTLFGALLGGVVLKVLGAEMRKSGMILSADALRFSELYVSPQMARHASETLVELEQGIGAVNTRLKELADSFGAVIGTIDSKQTVLAAGLAGLTEAVGAASERALALSSAVVAEVDRAVGETNRLADERLGALVSSLDQASQQSAVRSAAWASALDEGNRLANERLETTVKTVQSVAEQTHLKSEERLSAVLERIGLMSDQALAQAGERTEALANAVASAVEGVNQSADERLRVLAQTVESAADHTRRQADEHLAGFVESIAKAIEASRKDAERRLDAQAARISGKLGEAAAALAAMASPNEGE